MSATMMAAVFHGPEDVRTEEVPKPDPAALEPDEVLIRVEKAAICGTDLHPYEGRLEMEEGVVLGHEFLGTIEATGSQVALLTEGDRAVASCVATCGMCYMCRRGEPGRCIGMRMFGMGFAFGDLQGAQAEYVVVPWADRTLRVLPDGVIDDDVLLAGDVMTTAYEAVHRAMRPGDTVAIIGAGPVGLCSVMAANALGAGQVIAIDMVVERLEKAAGLGATVVNADESNAAEAVSDMTDWRGADVVIDSVGHPVALQSACEMVRSGGTISIPGAYTEEELSLPWGDLWIKGVTFKMGITHFENHIDEVMGLIAQGKLNPGAVVSDHVPLSGAREAYERFHAREVMKVVLDTTV